MHNKIKSIILLLVLFMVGGCSHTIDKTLSPPSDTKWVSFEVKNPSRYTKPFPLEVRYISNDCQKKRVSGFDGSVISEPSYNVTKIPLHQEGNSWKTKVAISGGGACKWTLSAVNMGIKYTDATHLGKELVPGTAVGVTLAFDSDASRNGQFDIVHGNNIMLSPTYYPLIETNKMEHEIDTLNIFGEEDFLQKKISSVGESISIKFNPKLNESKVVRMIAPSKYKVGDYFKIIYPDGTIVSDGTIHPDIKMVK